MDFVRRWSEKTEIGAGRFIGWLNITASKFYDWRDRYGKVNEHNGWVPRDCCRPSARLTQLYSVEVTLTRNSIWNRILK